VASTSLAIGAAAVLASSFTSGLANIIFEKLVKRNNSKIGDGALIAKQLQLGFWTSLFTAVEILRRSGFSGLNPTTLTDGWTAGVWGIVFLKSVGGLLVAGTIKYADNIVKTFATASAIIVTTLATSRAVGPRPASFFAGCSLVVASIFLYAFGAQQPPKLPNTLAPSDAPADAPADVPADAPANAPAEKENTAQPGPIGSADKAEADGGESRSSTGADETDQIARLRALLLNKPIPPPTT